MLTKSFKTKDKSKKWRGLITFSTFKIEGKEAEKIEQQLGDAKNIPTEEFNKLFSRLNEICTVREHTFENQIVLVGREVFARRLIDDLTYSGVINYGALGSSSTAVSDAQTTLVAEVKRKGIATRSRSGDTVTLRFFFTKSDTNGTYQEFGTFIDGTASADTGQMFNRALTGGWVKTALEAMTVTVQLDLNPA